jgi:quinol monooxygenase YgiN
VADRVSWLLELAVKPGKLEDFRALMDEMVESTRAESGALAFEWFIGEDEDVVHIYERYADSEAVLTHLATFGETFAARFLDAVDATRLTVLGAPTDEARRSLTGLGATFLAPLGGFAR